MRLLEYQAKELFKEFGIRTPPSISSKDIEKGRKDAKELGYPFVIKVQVPVGGRGKAGGMLEKNKIYGEERGRTMAKKTFEEMFKVKKEKHRHKKERRVNQDLKTIRSFEDAENYDEEEEDKYLIDEHKDKGS